MCSRKQKVEISDVSNEIVELTKAMAIFDISKVKSKTTYASCDSDSSYKKETETDSSSQSEQSQNKYNISEILEKKIDNITVLLMEQNELMMAIKKEVSRSNIAVQNTVDTHAKLASELLEIATDERDNKLGEKSNIANNVMKSGHSASILMAGLGIKQKTMDDTDLRSALEDLLLSEPFKEQLTECSSAALKSVLNSTLLKGLCSCYMSGLKKSQCRVVNEISKILDVAFRKLETNAAVFTQESSRASRSMRMALDRHLIAMESATTINNDLTDIIQDTIHDVLEDELIKWRESLHEAYAKEAIIVAKLPQDYQPQAIEPAAIAQLRGESRQELKINSGDVNRSFEQALSAIDITVVVAMCRNFDSDLVFGPPCLLNQNVLLSLIQQLSTDMLQDTELKCRYIEEAVMCLKEDDIVTRSHVANVFRDAIRHLKVFLTLNANHTLARRLKMIIMAADSFLMKVFY